MIDSAEMASCLAFLILTYLPVLYATRILRGKKNALLLLLAGITVAAAVKLAWDMSRDKANYYRILEVGRHSSAFEVRKSYKQVSRVLHPDKNPSPTAEADFQRAKVAYDVLMDEKLRDVYNRFGPSHLNFDPRHDELKLISSISIMYIFWLVVLSVTTIPQGSRASRMWSIIIGLSVMAVEVCFSVMETTVPAWLPGAKYVTEAELVLFLQRLLPAAFVALRCVSEAVYLDLDETTLAFLREVERHMGTTQSMLLQLKTLVASTSGGSSVNGGGAANLEEVSKAVDELKESIDEGETARAAMVQKIKTSSNDPVAGYYWLVMVAMYGGMYLLGGGGEEPASSK
jgi:hypothetical protein